MNSFLWHFSCSRLSWSLSFSRGLWNFVLNFENRLKLFASKNSFTQLNFGFPFSHFSRCLNRHVVSWERKRRRTSSRIYADEILTSDTIFWGLFFLLLSFVCLSFQSFIWRWRMWKLQTFSHSKMLKNFRRIFFSGINVCLFDFFWRWRHRRILLNIITHKGISLFSIKGGCV